MITSLILVLMSVARAVEKTAPKQLLHLSITCAGDASTASRDHAGRRLAKYNKGAKIHLVEMSWPCFGEEAAQRAAVEELIGRLDRLVETVPFFDLIALDLPDFGATRPGATPLGQLGEGGLDENFKAALRPLEKRANENGKVLFLTSYAFAKEYDGNAGRVDGLREFFGSTRGDVFGLHQAKQFVEPLSWSKDVRLSTLALSLSSALTGALLFRPEIGFTAIGLGFLYDWTFRFLFRQFGGTPDKKVEVEGLDYSSVPKFIESIDRLAPRVEEIVTAPTVNSFLPSLLSNLIVTFQFLGPAGISPAFLKTVGVAAAVLIPLQALAIPVLRRFDFMWKTVTFKINSGWLRQNEETPQFWFQRLLDLDLYRGAKHVYSCERYLDKKPKVFRSMIVDKKSFEIKAAPPAEQDAA